VKRIFLLLLVVLSVMGLGVAVSYQLAARERHYRDLVVRGDVALRNDQTFGAIEAYSGAIALRGDSMLPYLRRGETYMRRGELEAAARDLQTAVTLDPTATRPLDELGDIRYLQQSFDLAGQIYEQYLRLDDRAAHVSYKLALAHFREGKLDAALTALDATLRLNDRLADAHYLRGLCLRDQRRFREAQQAFVRAVELSPGLIPAREELADLYAALARRRDELEQLQVIADLDRDHPERQVAVGLAYARWAADPQEPASRRAGHADHAVQTLSSALERTPDHPLLCGALGRVWLDIAQSRNDPVALNNALEALERVGSTNDATSEMLTLYGRALLQSGQVDLAERTLQQATERYPVEPTAFLFYATAAEQQSHWDAARQAWLLYDALVGDDRDFLPRAERIATLSLHMNDTATAIEWLQRANAVGADARLAGLLAEAQLKAGDRPAAEATIERGLGKYPTDAALLALSKRLR
jgi:tetratricopeptide (TPR) repeat protein